MQCSGKSLVSERPIHRAVHGYNLSDCGCDGRQYRSYHTFIAYYIYIYNNVQLILFGWNINTYFLGDPKYPYCLLHMRVKIILKHAVPKTRWISVWLFMCTYLCMYICIQIINKTLQTFIHAYMYIYSI